MLAKEIKTGSIVVHNGDPVVINSLKVQTPSARGAATLYVFRGKNIVTRQKVDIKLKGTESLEEADFQSREVKLMYTDQESAHFLDQEDYNQYSLSLEDVSEEISYITEDLEGMSAMIYNDECVGISLPAAVVLKITHCDPGVKGNSATSRTKPATLETGLEIQVPEYLKEGETVKVDTRTGEYLSRA
ncbi:MAG: elongation factor P [Planctomycetota bacterium]|nr:elongation factor P [Planctomycetota bacterium]